MKPLYAFSAPLMISLLSLVWGCDKGRDSQRSLKGQINLQLTFYGLCVDEAGRPLEGAEFVIEVEAIPNDWTFDTRGKPHSFSTVTVESDRDGRFQVPVSGHVLRFKRVTRAGYRHLFDMDTGDSRAIDNMSYMLIAWGDPWYKSDPAYPAVYVFVRDGSRDVAALPCAGGYHSGGGKQWTLNAPGWPKNPSLKDVVYKLATTRPSSRPARARPRKERIRGHPGKE